MGQGIHDDCWIASLDKRPAERTGEDLDVIFARLKHVKAFEKFHPLLLQQICYYSYYEQLETGVILFRQGDLGTNWYAVLSGSLNVNISETGHCKDAVTLYTLGVGTALGESILNDTPRPATVITSEPTQLLRVEQRDFKVLWEKNKQLMEGVFSEPLSLVDTGYAQRSSDITVPGGGGVRSLSGSRPLTAEGLLALQAGHENMAGHPAIPPINATPSERLFHAGYVLRTILLTRAPHMIRDRKYHLRTYRRCLVGSEMVDWLIQQSSIVKSRNQAVGMWQALLEEGVIVHVCHEHQFKDKFLFYRFHDDDHGVGGAPGASERHVCEDEMPETLSLLAQLGPDAMMRMILRKPPASRSVEDLEIIYEELLHIKALSHLSTMVKRELASVFVFESHAKAGTVLFNQGDEGASWYIILKGSVNVVIYGKGVVCTLHEGDDFGKLALVNDAPRAATIVLQEDNCHFLRVDKEDFNRILRDVEANTVRLKEHGQDVLVLEKIPTKTLAQDGTLHSHYKYSVMAGTPEKMIEHLLETRLSRHSDSSDTFLEDFLLTHVIFMPSNHLCPTLMAHYHADVAAQGTESDCDYALTNKRRVVQFVQHWSRIIQDAFWEDKTVIAFLEELHSALGENCKSFPQLKDEYDVISNMFTLRSAESGSSQGRKSPTGATGSVSPVGTDDQLSHTSGERGHSSLTQKLSPTAAGPHSLGSKIPFRKTSRGEIEDKSVQRKPIKPYDQNVFKIFCADHTYTTLKLAMDASVTQILSAAETKLGLRSQDLVLCEVKPTGERVVFRGDDLCVTTGLSVNGRLFVSPREHIDALTPLQEQEGPTATDSSMLELLSSKEVAYQLTAYDWELYKCVHVYELLYLVFGRYNFVRITANLDIFLRRFNEVQYWVITEMCLTNSLSKRVQLLRKFIKIAAYCKEYKNMCSFFAIIMGLSNIAVSRLSQTWERLPSKFKKMYSDFELAMDPSRNHRAYRLAVSKMEPPVIPFMPLLMKDMTFTHEGNKTYFDGLVNFEKMNMIGQTLRMVSNCRSQEFAIEPPASSKSSYMEVRNYIRSLHLIDNQRVLNQLSIKLEPRRS